jgi:pentatricopeptide repeat protein
MGMVSRFLAAFALAFLLLAVVEAALRIFVPPPELDLDDPYLSFTQVSPLFLPDEGESRFETDPARLAFFRPQSFAAEKGDHTFRIFCLGGSTVQGRPYAVETSFTTWLMLNLRAARPDMEYEVVNCGGVSYASYRLIPIMQELLSHEPDLFILYTGHNEFLEDRTYRRLKNLPPVLTRLHGILLHLRSYALATEFLSSRGADQGGDEKPEENVLPAEVEAKLDFVEGLEWYHRDDVWRQGILEHFRRNLETMVLMARRAGVEIILMNPAFNLEDCPPFKSQFSDGLSMEQLRQVMGWWKKAGDLDAADTYGRIRLLEQAAEIDPRHAEILFQLGSCYARLGRLDEAKKWFVQAKEEDICPLRILEPMREGIAEVASTFDVPLVDVQQLLNEHIEDGILGNEWLLDHVHPSIEGHQLIADALYRHLASVGKVKTPPGWKAARDALWQRHLSSLDKAYYARGAARLKRLLEWCRGIAPRPPTRVEGR